ncbi:MAG TPA: glycosyltransferase family 2 protein [Terriglobia bacterium]|nr:glycosyltransferase family 2 protein [Terriglobia bacterium]
MNRSFCLSVAVPIHNEAKILPELLRRLSATLDHLEGGPHQMVFVDDGSSDGSTEILEDAVHRDARVTVISLSRNFGHQAALTAALDHVSGDAVVLMDGDLQDVPESIPLLVEQYRLGYDVVYAVRASRREGLALRFCYFLFYRLQSLLAETRPPLDAGDFGLMSRRVVEQLRQMPEHHRYLRGLRSWVGFRQIGVPIERAERRAGRSKYSLFKLIKLAADGIFAFSTWPLRAATMLGASAAAASVLFSAYSLYAKLFLKQSPQGFTALILLITFLAGILLFFMGIIGEYVGRVYEEIKARPLYVVNRITDYTGLNLEAEAGAHKRLWTRMPANSGKSS